MELESFEVTIFVGPVVHSVHRDQVTVIERAAIVVQDGKITEVKNLSKDSNLKAQFPSAEIIALRNGQFLIPGLIDTHIHACQIPNAGLGYDKPLLDWLNSYTFPLEACYKDVEFARKVYTSVVKRTLSCGSTTAVYFGTIHRQSCKVLAEIVHQAGQRAWVGKVNMDRRSTIDLTEETTTSVIETEKFIEDVISLKSKLVKPIIMPRFAITSSTELMEQLASLALRHDLLIETHMSENTEEIREVKKIFSSSYAKVYDDAQLLNKKTILAHCVHLEEMEISLLRDKEVSVSHCPNSNICLHSGLCDVRKLLESSVNVSLGTDIAGGCSPSMLDAIRSALTTSITLSFSKPNYKPLTYHEAFYLATMGGAIAVNEESYLGNFAVGKYFDAIIVDAASANSQIDILTELTTLELFQKFIYTGDDRNVYKVFVNGILVHERS